MDTKVKSMPPLTTFKKTMIPATVETNKLTDQNNVPGEPT